MRLQPVPTVQNQRDRQDGSRVAPPVVPSNAPFGMAASTTPFQSRARADLAL